MFKYLISRLVPVITIFFLALSQNALSKDKLNIIFVGNSYTFFNNMPEMVSKIAQSDSQNKIVLETEKFTVGGARLITLWNNKKALQAIKSQPRDFVIFQDQSLWAMYPDSFKSSYQVAPKWREAVSPVTSHIALFVTWARKPHSNWYTSSGTPFLKNAEYMQQQINLRSKKLSSLLGAHMIPVGDYWAYVSKHYPKINLYKPDGSHPSVAGTYLTALVFYRYFTGLKSVKSVSYVPKGMKSDDAIILRKIVSY